MGGLPPPRGRPFGLGRNPSSPCRRYARTHDWTSFPEDNLYSWASCSAVAPSSRTLRTTSSLNSNEYLDFVGLPTSAPMPWTRHRRYRLRTGHRLTPRRVAAAPSRQPFSNNATAALRCASVNELRGCKKVLPGRRNRISRSNFRGALQLACGDPCDSACQPRCEIRSGFIACNCAPQYSQLCVP